MFIKGKKCSIENLFKIIIKKLNKYNFKSFILLFQLCISFLCFIFKTDIKTKTNSKLLYLLENKISYCLKFLILKINMKRCSFNFILYFNNLLTEKKLFYKSIFNTPNLLLFYRW